MQIKQQKGRLLLRCPLSQIIQEQCSQNGLLLLAIEPGDIFGLAGLPPHHSDPFDRIIISQAKRRRTAIATDDAEFAKYGAKVIW